MSESFCIIPWLQAATKPNGDIRVCCLMTSDSSGGAIRKPNGDPYNFSTDTIDEAKNGDFAKEIRLSMLHGEKHKACQVCWNKEDVGVTSKRQTSNKWYNWFTVEQAKHFTDPDGSTTAEPVYWDLRFGNLCNLKCVMCHPASSSQWYEDYFLVTGEKSYYDNGKKITLDKNEKGRLVATNGTYNWHESDKFWKHMESKIPHLQQVYLVGGEPLMIEQHYEFLQKIIDAGKADKVTLEYDTNLTNVQPRVLELWKHFKLLWIRGSIDDYNEQNDYIRFPSKWKQIEKNIQTIKQADIKTRWDISTTWQLYNVYTVQNLWRYFDDTCSTRILNTPRHLEIKILPKHVKQKAIDILKQYQQESKKPDKVIPYINYLEKHLDYVDEKNLQYFAKFTQSLDKSREVSFAKTFPELYNDLKEYFDEQ